MAKIFRMQKLSTRWLEKRKVILLEVLCPPPDAIRASYVQQFLTCGKRNCRCQRGHKHGPFHYLVQCVSTGNVTKFLLKTPQTRKQARAGIAAYTEFQERLEELSQLNTELLRRSAKPFVPKVRLGT
ncbi:MAG: hypothetical protein HOP33_14455 [Verrucomicrobia bacterium]|nr:hypothetical protein [Verrucomicrobiota bacterium]